MTSATAATVADVALDHGEPVRAERLGEVAHAATGEVVEHDDLGRLVRAAAGR